MSRRGLLTSSTFFLLVLEGIVDTTSPFAYFCHSLGELGGGTTLFIVIVEGVCCFDVMKQDANFAKVAVISMVIHLVQCQRC